MEFKEMKVGDTYKNWKNEIHEITMISKTGVVIECMNVETNDLCKFRFYNISGKYIKNGTHNTDLGKCIN